MYYVYVILGIILRSFVFQVNDGNDDWKELIHPEKYGLSQTQNFYIEVYLRALVVVIYPNVLVFL